MVHRESFELQRWALAQGVSSWLGDLEPNEWCRVAGVVTRLRLSPAEGLIEVCLADATGSVTARWAIRRPTPELALAPGRRVVLEGMTVLDEAGRVAVAEPVYELVDEEEPAR